MILKTLYLALERPGLTKEAKYAFKKSTRYLCNFIEREVLKDLKFKTEGFDRIVVSIVPEPTSGVPINPFHVACVEVAETVGLSRCSGDALTRVQIDLLRQGIARCAEYHRVPQREILEGLDLFQRQDFKNSWVYRNRVFRDFDLSAKLTCEMTREHFNLRLLVTHKGAPVYDDVILTTDPDEVAFAYKFKDIELTGGKLVVTAKSKTSRLWEKSLTELMAASGTGSDK